MVMELTPAMKQYWEIKRRYPDCIVLFRMGDFYETFYDDAKVVAKDLQIVLTSRGKGNKKTPLAGIPYHALYTHLKKLVDKGHKVVIAEQLEDPKKTKGLVKRGVVRVITPGTLLEESLLDSTSNNYIMSVWMDKDNVGFAVADISTGKVEVGKSSLEEFQSIVESHSPKEVIFPEGHEKLREIFKEARINEEDGYKFDPNNGTLLLNRMFGVKSFASYGLSEEDIRVKALSGFLSYLDYTYKGCPPRLLCIHLYNDKHIVRLDANTQRNLEIVKNLSDGGKEGTLLSVLDQTVTPMGSRMLRRWLLAPSREIDVIKERLEIVESLKSPLLIDKVRSLLREVGDIERILTRISYGNVQPRELVILSQSLKRFDDIKGVLKEVNTRFSRKVSDTKTPQKVITLIESSIKENAGLIKSGDFIKEGYSTELDELRNLLDDSRDWLKSLEEEERKRTGIKSLKIRYNKVAGYYIEVPITWESKVPKDYVRKQTFAKYIRFITPELKEKEVLLLNAEEKIREVESKLFQEVINELEKNLNSLTNIARIIGELDVYQSLSKVALERGYVKPEIHEGYDLILKGCRHPVVELTVPNFVTNDVSLTKGRRLMIITGPNMAGKSTLMRQVALIILMAHVGSFVPADAARIPIVDQIFTRVGARDDISRGQSTFMVEMVEAATILNNATEKSFIVFDEIGRGTSTYDGMAIAWAILECIAEKIKAKTMFATHYHLLNLLALKYSYIKNYNILVKEEEDRIVFLHKLSEGGTDKSYGVHVARLAGLPKEVIERANAISKELEAGDIIHRKTLGTLTSNREPEKKEKQTDIRIWTV
ncbi:MAG: DNA mismatch repair protein MutS [Candidatus Asgardarchaeia archaeon]